MLEFVKESTQSTESIDSLDLRFKEISDEIKSLQDLNLTEYDETLVRRIIDEVKVISEDKVLITFKGGIESEQFLR